MDSRYDIKDVPNIAMWRPTSTTTALPKSVVCCSVLSSRGCFTT